MLPWWVWDIVWVLSDLAWHIRQTADGIYDVWLVGVYLALPFYVAANYVESVSNLFIWTDGTNGPIADWILTLPSLAGVIDLLISYIPHFQSFISDPIGFIQDFFSQISADFWTFIYLTGDWFTEHFLAQATWLANFIDDPLGFTLDQLVYVAGWIVDFLENPLYYVDYWVRLLWPDIDDIISFTYDAIIGAIANVIDWIWEFLEDPLTWIQSLLAQFNVFVGLLLNDPYLFFSTCVALALNISLADLLDFPRYLWDYVLDWIVDYVQDTAIRFEQAVCDILMLFI